MCGGNILKREDRKILFVVMDGVGVRGSDYGNAVNMAHTPVLDYLKKNAIYRTLKAHGTYVGLPSDKDMGNSEVGHNALGAGRVFDQGAKLVESAIETGKIFEGECWQSMKGSLASSDGALHLIGLLSDGNVHSHEAHLFSLLEQAKKDGIKKVRVHALLDGRDVPEKSAEKYVNNLEAKMDQLRDSGFDIKVASGGGRMNVTMDRYEADWEIVKRGWDAQVEGVAPHYFSSLKEAVAHFRKDQSLTDQYLPPFVIRDGEEPVGKIVDGDAVVLFNFRGDRAIEVSRAFTEEGLSTFKRERFPKVFYAGMMEYDGDLHIPENYLVSPPAIDDTLGEYLVSHKIKQFACSETQKFGHVTYFWNGNKTGKFDEELEDYLEIPSDNIEFNQKPWMKAHEITEATIEKLKSDEFGFLRINFPNGDMVGHTGDFEAAKISMETVDVMVDRLLTVCKEQGVMMVITADHGNCDEMFEVKKGAEEVENWMQKLQVERPKPKTAHTLNEVPFYLFDPTGHDKYQLEDMDGSIANLASTVIELLGLPKKDNYLPSLVKRLG